MPFWKKKQISPQEMLKIKVRKKVRNQAKFLKHSIIYLVFLIFYLALAYIISAEEFLILGLILFGSWMIGLIFHGLSAFVFNRINSWEETRYQQKLKELRLEEEHSSDPHLESEEDEIEDPMDLKSYERLRKEMDDKWGEGDFV